MTDTDEASIFVDPDEIIKKVVRDYVDQYRRMEGKDPVDWSIHRIEVSGAEGDGVLSETSVRTTVPTGYMYLVQTNASTHELKVFPFKDDRVSNLDHDPVNHPSHYTNHPSGIECIDVTRHMSFNLGNVVKYVWRAGLKDQTPTVQDLEKAAWYLNDEIERRRRDELQAKRHQDAAVIKDEVKSIKLFGRDEAIRTV